MARPRPSRRDRVADPEDDVHPAELRRRLQREFFSRVDLADAFRRKDEAAVACGKAPPFIPDS
ncbi:hypothetical protein D3C85_1082680 [compost metagenome]